MENFEGQREVELSQIERLKRKEFKTSVRKTTVSAFELERLRFPRFQLRSFAFIPREASTTVSMKVSQRFSRSICKKE